MTTLQTITPDALKTMSPQQIADLINGLAAQRPQPKALTFKVSEKGGLSVYGLNVRFPVTLYVGQWERLIEAMPALKAFITANNAKLQRKS